MLKIKIGSTWAETRETEIPVTLRSPLFLDNGRIPGSFIFNFNLPHTPAMKEETGFIHRPARFGAKPQKKPFYLEYGPLKYKGSCTIENADEKTIEVSAPIETGDLAVDLKTKKLNEIDLGGVRGEESFILRVDSIMSEDEVLFGTTTPDPVIRWLLFDDIVVNTESELNAGTIFTSASSTVVTVIFDFKYLHKRSEYVQIRLMKNGEVFSSSYFSKNNQLQIFLYDVPVTIGDELSWQLYFIGDPVIDFTLQAGSRIRVYHSWDGLLNTSVYLYPDSDYVMFPVENSKFMDKLEDDTFSIDHVSIKETYEKYFPILNYYKDNRFQVGMSGEVEGETFSAFNIYSPFPYLAYVMKQAFNELGLNVINNVFEDEDLRQLVIFELFGENSFITSELIQPREGFNLADHVSDDLLSDYLTNLCKLFAIGLKYNSYTKTLEFKYLKDIISDRNAVLFPGVVISIPVLKASAYNGYILRQNITGDDYFSQSFKSLSGLTFKGVVSIWNLLPSTGNQINDCYYISFWKEYWYYNYDPDAGILNWMFYSKNFFAELKGDNNEDPLLDITTDVCAVMMNHGSHQDTCLSAPDVRGWLVPKTMRAGNFDGLPDYFKADFARSLLFYRGMEFDSQDNLYPLGTNDVYNYDGVRIDKENHTANLSLHWEGEYGLWLKRHKAWVEWMVANPGYFTIKAWLSPLQLSQIDWFKWYRLLGHDYLIREIRFNILDDRISECEIDLMRR